MQAEMKRDIISAPSLRRLTSRMSSESYPGYPECVVSCHGAGGFANSIRPFFDTPVARDCCL